MSSPTVDKDLCIACGLCSQTCPDVFELNNDEGYADVKEDPSECDEAGCCEEAADLCPVDAIEV
ncbi:ferredoxin [Candidatus Bipolaricaulota bacterium]|nr:ferredoxin [Candidatus Bipolaricaulota bacterium]MBS3813954.1 ferredoxin [Candidatus Bipolaricaulota bacterium]MBS3825846.1 ferredoxin [Candidatus Bipolaricaulota bacterium]